jgi:hypothetical protein
VFGQHAAVSGLADGAGLAASSARTCSATSSPLFATSISAPGSKNCSSPSQASVIRQAAAPAASNTRVAGEKP